MGDIDFLYIPIEIFNFIRHRFQSIIVFLNMGSSSLQNEVF